MSEPEDVTAPDPDADPTEPRPAAGGLRAALGDDFSFATAVGGTRGLIESTAPGLLFVVVYVATRELTPALVASLAAAVLAVVVRLVQRTPITQALSGVIGVVIGVVWARWTGRAQDYFAGGLIANVAYLLAMAASVVARWPLVGVVVAFARGEDMSWRTDPERAHERRRFVWATWVLAGVFVLRLAVQVPLYLAGEDAIGALGTAKLVMGVPLFAVALWITWLLVASPGARAERRDRRPTPPR